MRCFQMSDDTNIEDILVRQVVLVVNNVFPKPIVEVFFNINIISS